MTHIPDFPSAHPASTPSPWHHPDHLFDCLRLARTDRIGPTTFKLLMRSFATPDAAVDALPNLYLKGFLKPLELVAPHIIDREISETEALGGTFEVYGSTHYPSLLAHIPTAPPILSLYGHASLLDHPLISIVGARNASAAALTVTQKISECLSQHGLVGVSGLARGIDTAVHKAMLDAGTIAVLGNGVDISYPPENKRLQNDILAAGLVITEHPPGTAPQSHHFPQRNRIIAGLSIATLVIEAARRSGSLITARFAADFGRTVLAVPGSPLDPRCHGSNHLLREGAVLVETAEDIMDALEDDFRHSRLESPHAAPLRPTSATEMGSPDPDELAHLKNLLSPTPTHIEDLVTLSQIPLARLSLYLALLDLEGVLYHSLDGRVSHYPGTCKTEHPIEK